MTSDRRFGDRAKGRCAQKDLGDGDRPVRPITFYFETWAGYARIVIASPDNEGAALIAERWDAMLLFVPSCEGGGYTLLLLEARRALLLSIGIMPISFQAAVYALSKKVTSLPGLCFPLHCHIPFIVLMAVRDFISGDDERRYVYVDHIGC